MSITVSEDNGIATITLDDDRANAINPDWLDNFLENFSTAEANSDAVMIVGRAGVFSGGFDLKWLPSASPEQLSALLDKASEMVTRIYGSPKPVIGVCTGHAMAMGMFMLMCCDTRLAAAGEFKFGANETMNNMDLPVFATEIPRDRIDNRHLTRFLIQSHIFGPEEAAELGVVDRVVEGADLMPAARQAAEMLAKLPARAYANNKLAVRQKTIDTIAAAIGSY